MSFKRFLNSHFVFGNKNHISFLQGSSFRFAVIRRMQLSFTQPTADIFYSSFSFIFLDEASTLTFSAAKLVQATFLQVPGALFSEFFQKLFRLLLIQKTFHAQG